MQSQVKEFFNSIQREENSENKTNKQNKRSTRTLGIAPDIDYKIPEITNFSHFMECEVAPNICPLMWETLDIDFDNSDRRYCDYCQQYIYKADNEMMIKKLKDENKCMAISNELLEKINGKIDEERFEQLQLRLSISKLFMYFRKFNPEEFQDMQEEKLSYNEQLKEILLFAIDHKEVEEYINLEIDMENIYQITLKYCNDEKFIKMIQDSISKHQKS